MNWETFYLVCFLVGLLLSAFSLLGGMGHIGGHVPVPHAHIPHLPAAGHVPHLPQAAHLPPGTAGQPVQAGATVPWWNAFSIMIFLCWFGAAGYLLTRYGGFVAGVVLVVAGVCGLAEPSSSFSWPGCSCPTNASSQRTKPTLWAWWATFRPPSVPPAPGKLFMSRWARCTRPPRARRTANRFQNRKRSLSSATKEESPTSGVGKRCRKAGSSLQLLASSC